MSAATDYLEDAIGDHLFGASTWSKPAALYIGLLTAVPDAEAGTVTEVSAPGYARVQNDPGSANWAKANNEWSNAAQLDFPAPTGTSWGVLTHVALFDAATAGNVLAVLALTQTKSVGGNDPAPFFAAGELKFVID